MSAEAFAGVVSKELLNKLLSQLANDEITLGFGCKQDLMELAHNLTIMLLLLRTPRHRPEYMNLWLKKLKSVACDADHVLEMFAFESLRRKVEISITNKVHTFFSISNPIAFCFKMAHGIKNINKALDELIQEAKGYDLTPLDYPRSHRKVSPDFEQLWTIQEVTDDDDDACSVFSSLELSFNNLPSTPLKQCFAYCSIFPKGFVMEKENLIQLWMAQGFLESSKGKDTKMEDIGSAYFNILLENSFLQNVERDGYGNVTRCQMNGPVLDLAQSLSRSEILVVDGNKSNNRSEDGFCEILHLSLTCRGEEMCASTREECFGRLRTFFCNVDADDILLKFKCLRTLNLCGSDIKSLPESVGELITLRYLDISNTRIQRLPYFITKLYNLETLKVLNCSWLDAFPIGMKNLINMRHIYFSPSSLSQPMEIGCLTRLQTLSSFAVGKEKGCQIEELGALNELRGALNICNLENVRDGEEARRANLARKTRIYNLGLEWKLWRNDGEMHFSKDREILECLQPHSSLKSLRISSFEGGEFPSWMQLLENLVEMELSDSLRCETLPTLGGLPRLRKLKIFGMAGVKCIGSEFYGKDGTKSSPSFPSLKELTLESMAGLKEWKEASEEITVFSCLEKLKIKSCLSLAIAPSHFPSLRELEVEGVVASYPIDQICSKLTTLVSLSIANIYTMYKLPDGLLLNNKNLSHLSIRSCDQLKCLGHTWSSALRTVVISICQTLCCMQGLSVLESLSIHFCRNLTFLPSIEGLGLTSFRELDITSCDELRNLPSGIQSCTSLESMSIYHCYRLTMSSDTDNLDLLSIKDLASLQTLSIIGCQRMTRLPDGLECLTGLKALSIGEFSRELDEFPSLSSVQALVSLEKLTLSLSGLDSIMNLPNELQHMTWIQELHVQYFNGSESLPDWLGKLSSLRHLHIQSCWKLKYLPAMESMRSLSKLKKLTIWYCPHMIERCAKGSGPEWFKISHIPEIDIA